jgi:uncharacterized protein YdbL (DUF1318 family)
MNPRLPALFLPLLLASCAPTVNVAVPKPVTIDVNMKVDVTSRTEGPAKTNAPQTPAEAAEGAASHHNLLSGEVQSLKNSRLVGEDNRGYLAVRQTPSGKLPSGEDYGAYVNRIVKEENDARRTLDMQTASKEGAPLQTIEAESAKRWQDAAFAGEWIQDADGTWKQK